MLTPVSAVVAASATAAQKRSHSTSKSADTDSSTARKHRSSIRPSYADRFSFQTRSTPHDEKLLIILALLTITAIASVWTLLLTRQQGCIMKSLSIDFVPTPFGRVNVDPTERDLPQYEPSIYFANCPLRP